MIRMLGAVLLIAGCGGLGLGAVGRLDGRVRDLRELAAGLDAMERELGWRLAPLPEALEAAGQAAGGGAARFFTRCAQAARHTDGRAFQELWRDSLEAAPLRLAEGDRALLRRLGPVLGRYDGDSQRRALEEASAELRALREGAAEDRRRLGRVYTVLGVAGGLLLVILLI